MLTIISNQQHGAKMKLSRISLFPVYKAKTKPAFTLAEVLLTLTIVGVIATITIPAIIQSIEVTQYRVAWKECYSILDQATKRALSDNAGSFRGIFTDSDIMKNKYLPYLNYIKSCDGGESFDICVHNDGKWKYMDNSLATGWGPDPGIVLSNGFLLRLIQTNVNCTEPNGSVQRCGVIFVDVNGFKQPNTVGRDIFAVHIQEKGIKPYGTQGDAIDPCSAGYDGFGCSAVYLYQ